MGPNKRTARIAGSVYLIIIISGFFSILYVPSQIMDWSNPTVTFNNIVKHTLLFKWSIITGVICYTSYLILPFILYYLLNGINKVAAQLMFLLAVVSVPISLVNLTNKMNVLSLIKDPIYLNSLGEKVLHSQVFSNLEFFANGNFMAQVFWGLWLLPFGYLVYKSGFIPKFLGVFLILGCFGYLTDSISYFLDVEIGNSIVSTIIGICSGVGEIGTCLWLLIMGIRTGDKS